MPSGQSLTAAMVNSRGGTHHRAPASEARRSRGSDARLSLIGPSIVHGVDLHRVGVGGGTGASYRRHICPELLHQRPRQDPGEIALYVCRQPDVGVGRLLGMVELAPRDAVGNGWTAGPLSDRLSSSTGLTNGGLAPD